MSSRAASKSRWRLRQAERQWRISAFEAVARQLRALRERQRLVEQRYRRGDTRQQVAADPHAHEHVGAVDVGERRALGDRPCRREQVECLPDVTGTDERTGVTGEGLHLQLRCSGGTDLVTDAAEQLQRLVGTVRERQRLGARQRRLDAPAGVRRDADREKLRDRRRGARQATRSCPRVGRVLARSIWLTYSFEKRSPASSV